MMIVPRIRPAMAVAALIVLAGCESLTEPGGLFGDDAKIPLAGERISVLLNQRSLSPEPELAGKNIVLPAPTPNASWPQAGGYANHAMHHITVGDNLTALWQADAGAGASDEVRLIGSPVVSGGRVFAMDSATAVSAFDANTGRQMWRRPLTPPEEQGDDHIGGGLAFENGVIFATTGFAQVIAMDAASGKILWRKRVVGPMRAAPTVRAGRVFAITIDSR
ncbi:MAG TPA: pyrrolo-quinoline quinone, partial [Rhodospirillales bacterium]|nr:pyrrolo-quinoline quinone [Rhodospirillales bacterium]